MEIEVTNATMVMEDNAEEADSRGVVVEVLMSVLREEEGEDILKRIMRYYLKQKIIEFPLC